MRKAFTLIELLVVVAIIALLVTLLLPTFYLVKVITRQTICQTNHHTLIRGVVAYSAEWQGYMPRANWLSTEAGPGWLYDPSERGREGNVPELVRNSQLGPYIAAIDTYRCPADEEPPSGMSRLGTNNITSYLMNGAVVGYGRVGRTGGTFKRAQFDAWDICFWECDPTRGNFWNDGSSVPWEGHTIRHRGGLTVGCFGGNTDWITEDEYYYQEQQMPGRWYCAPDTSNGR